LTTPQEQVRWHYQWIVVNEFLPVICDPQIVEAIFRDRLRFFRFEDE
jgi:Animal haem peroxidase